MLRVNSETVKTVAVFGKRSVASCIEENVQRPTLNVQHRMQNCPVCDRRRSLRFYGDPFSDSLLDSFANARMLARL